MVIILFSLINLLQLSLQLLCQNAQISVKMCNKFSTNFILTFSVFLVSVMTCCHFAVISVDSIFFACDRQLEKIRKIIYITYYYSSEKCGSINITDLFPEHAKTVKQFEFPRQVLWYSFVNNYSLIYCITDAVWLVQSVLLLFAVICRLSGYCTCIFHMPWVCTGLMVITLDVVGFSIFLHHVLKIKTFTDWLTLVGVKNASSFKYLNDKIKFPFLYPSLVMTLRSIRGFIFFIANVMLILTVARKSIDVYKQKSVEDALNVQVQLE